MHIGFINLPSFWNNVRMTLLVSFLIIYTTTMFNCANSANILGIFPICSRSHAMMQQVITKALVARGHQVTVISPHKLRSPLQNYTDISLYKLHDGQRFIDSISIEQTRQSRRFWNNMVFARAAEKELCLKVFQLPYIQELIKSENKTIDLLLAEMHGTRCYNLLAYKLKVPMIAVLPSSASIGVDYWLGNPFFISHTPQMFRPRTTRMNFWQRLMNTVEYSITFLYYCFLHNDPLEQISEDVFNMELPPNEVLSRQIAMSFVNNHLSLVNRAYSPNSIPLAGIHIEEANELPKDLQDFIDESTDGVIYVSFGSFIKVSSIDPQTLKIFVEVFSEIPQRILWRVDDLNMLDVPPNVRIAKWYPQRDILEHEDVIAIITHGGIFSFLEAIYTKTPIIGIPFQFDQFQNVQVALEQEIAVYLNYDTLTKSSFRKAVDDIVNNTKYRENINKRSGLLKDRSKSTLDEALYLSEYIIRHNGAPNMRLCAADMPMYQYLLLDVTAVVLIMLINFLLLCKIVFRVIQRVMLSIFKKDKEDKNKGL